MRVLLDEALPVGLDQLVHLHRLRDHRADDRQERHGALVVAVRRVLQLDAKLADRALVKGDRDGDAGDLLDALAQHAAGKARIAFDLRQHIGRPLRTTSSTIRRLGRCRAGAGRPPAPDEASTSISPVCWFSSTTRLEIAP